MNTNQKNPEYQSSSYPPVVAVLGHVDHGKTSLLDAIRKTNIAQREHGGITQRIGASKIELVHDGQKQTITFIDTPGHEAFSKMRGRGAVAADIALLVVSAVDGVMPQTKESIQLLQQNNVPFIVVLTKSDLPEKNSEKVKQQLAKENILLEGYGGDVPVIEVSARMNRNIKELLDLILLFYSVKQEANTMHPSADQSLQALVIESHLDPKSGPRATIVIKNGTIRIKDEVVTENIRAKIRSIIDPNGEQIQTASVGEAVEVLGFTKVPSVGSIVYAVNHASTDISEQTNTAKNEKEIPEHMLSVILCTDTAGALEAIIHALPENVHIIEKRTGEITENDVMMAKTTKAIILGFNAKIRPNIVQLALNERVLIKNYTIIYELLDEIKEVIEGKRLARLEQIFGTARILATFPFEKSTVLGISVMDGRIARGDKIRLMREEKIIGEATIVSLRQGKNTTSKVEKGNEAGILISPLLDFQLGDVILSHS